MICAIAKCLGDLREEVVFLGGATLGLLITDPTSLVEFALGEAILRERQGWKC